MEYRKPRHERTPHIMGRKLTYRNTVVTIVNKDYIEIDAADGETITLSGQAWRELVGLVANYVNGGR